MSNSRLDGEMSKSRPHHVPYDGLITPKFLLKETEKWFDECIMLRKEHDYANLTLATLCDMVLGEDAVDRSDTALIKAIGTMIRNNKCTSS